MKFYTLHHTFSATKWYLVDAGWHHFLTDKKKRKHKNGSLSYILSRMNILKCSFAFCTLCKKRFHLLFLFLFQNWKIDLTTVIHGFSRYGEAMKWNFYTHNYIPMLGICTCSLKKKVFTHVYGLARFQDDKLIVSVCALACTWNKLIQSSFFLSSCL